VIALRDSTKAVVDLLKIPAAPPMKWGGM